MRAGALMVIALPALASAPPGWRPKGAPGLLPHRRQLRIPLVAVAGPGRLARSGRRAVQHDWRGMSKQATWRGVVSAAICLRLFWSGNWLCLPWLLLTIVFAFAALTFKDRESPVVAAAEPEPARRVRPARRGSLQHDWRGMSKQATWRGVVSAAICLRLFWSGNLLGLPWLLLTITFAFAALTFKDRE